MSKIIIKAKCNDCGAVMLDSHPMTPEEVHKDWASLVMSAPLNCPPCPKCGYSTFSDCNSNFKLELYNADTNRKMNKDKFFKANKQ